MTTTPLAIGALAAALVGLVLQPMVLRAMRAAAVVDMPNERSSHTTPTPRGGGVAVVLGAAAGLLHVRPALAVVLALLLYAAIGLAEDLRGVPVRTRLALQLGAGAVTGALLLPAGLAAPAMLAGVLALALWLTTYANASNFMDGINGISAVHAALAGAVYAGLGLWQQLPVLTAVGLVTAAASLTFLPWNAGRARIFLGDVGAYGLGGLLAAAAAYGLLHGAPAEAVLAPLALNLADTGWTLARRYYRGEPWHRPHRTHAYQRLTDLGWSHQRVTAATALASAAVCTCALAAAGSGPLTRAALDLLAVAILAGYLVSPAALATYATHDGRGMPAGVRS